LAACSVVTITEKSTSGGTSNDVDGIPFYVKIEKFKHTSVYLQTWLRATLTVELKVIDKKDNKEVVVEAGKQPYVTDLPIGPNPELADIKTKILSAESLSAGSARDVIDAFKKLKAYDPQAATPELVANTVASEWVVDGARMFYLNAWLPWFGTGSITQKIAADGTLTEATSTQDTKLAEGLSSLVPFKEYLTGRFVETPNEAIASAPEGQSLRINHALMSINSQTTPKSPAESELDRRVVYAMTLAVEEVGYEYTIYSIEDKAISDHTALEFDDVKSKRATFTRKPIGGKEDEEKKGEGQKIGISGSIDFPKDWGSPDKEDK
jgi:hypothetical protein